MRAAGHEARGSDREIDVTDATAIRGALRDFAPDAVIHLAAMSSVAQSWREPALCYRLNFIGTRTLLSSVVETCPDARVLLIGSADQYAAGASDPAEVDATATGLIDESTPLRPRSPYARSKAAAEGLGALFAERGLDVVRIRAFNHTGAGQSDDFVASSFARQIAEIRLGLHEPVMRVGNLESVRDFLHVDDVLRAYLALLDRDVRADAYNVASERATSIQEVLDRLLSLSQVKARIERDPDRWRPTDRLVGSAARLRTETGWQPEIPLSAILAELYEDWLAKAERK